MNTQELTVSLCKYFVPLFPYIILLYNNSTLYSLNKFRVRNNILIFSFLI